MPRPGAEWIARREDHVVVACQAEARSDLAKPRVDDGELVKRFAAGLARIGVTPNPGAADIVERPSNVEQESEVVGMRRHVQPSRKRSLSFLMQRLAVVETTLGEARPRVRARTCGATPST